MTYRSECYISSVILNGGFMQIPVVKAVQNGSEFFVTAIPAKDLIKMTQVDVWSSEKSVGKEAGYQRAAESNHVNKIASYLRNTDATLPTAVFLNSRRALGFVESSSNSNFGTINLKPQDILWNVDGQHRVAGLRKAIEEDGITTLLDFDVPVVIASAITRDEEMNHFLTINRTQKGVRVDLTERLYMMKAQTEEGRDDLIGKGQYWIVRAVKIVDVLNTKVDSPWKGRIQMPNTKVKAPAKQGSLTKSMQPLLKGGFLEHQSESLSAQLLLIYWKAVQDVFPAAFDQPEDYAIQKTAGFFPLHAVANRIFQLCQADENKFKQDNMASYLKKAFKGAGIDEDFWRLDNEEGATLYGSMKGFKLLADKILRELPTPKLEI